MSFTRCTPIIIIIINDKLLLSLEQINVEADKRSKQEKWSINNYIFIIIGKQPMCVYVTIFYKYK